MQHIFETYIHSISSKFSYEETSEMGYRTDFEILLKGLFQSINVKRIDHDARSKSGNKPDFIILKHDIPILYIETKDIGISLDKVEKSEQMSRYFGYANLILTDYLELRFYRNGQPYDEPIKIADYNIKKRTISPIPNNYEHAFKTIIDFTQSHKEPIKSGEHLAKIMGGKAQRIRDNLLQFVSDDSDKNSEIRKIYKTLKKLLVHDLTTISFADMYAQTLVYGLFVARYYDDSKENFSRRAARELIPNSNPFLRHFFDHIVGPDFDKRLEYIVDELCAVFSHANVPLLMKQYFKDDLWGNTHEGPDPVIHFYEDFLKEYDAELRKRMGAYYTPQPVVGFIVRSVDYLLKTEFGLASGLADTRKSLNGVHNVQILDPAAGTGTFLSAIIRNIYLQLKNTGQIGRWPAYVHHDLLQRLHGFEIMMAPYTIAHLKLSMAFKATGFKHFNRRLGIYLTNSLEEGNSLGDLFTGFGFAENIAEETKEAILNKNNTPIMVFIGNPPYSVSSENKSDWILNLIKEYKKDLNEINIQSLSDDYIKFIRYAEHFIEKNKAGIVAMITNNSFIDGLIHRQMRKHLLETFDEIYILNLHGNAKKKETALDGSKDENVFDIQQGVAISIMIKKSDKNDKLGSVKYAELYGKRLLKFSELNKNELNTIEWQNLNYTTPDYYFVPKDFEYKNDYYKFFQISDLMPIQACGIVSARDKTLVNFNEDEAQQVIEDFNDLKESEFRDKYDLSKDSSDWTYDNAREEIKNASIEMIEYRPFDQRYVPYSSKSKGVIQRPRYEIMKHMIGKCNLGLIISKQLSTFDFQHIFVSKTITDKCTLSTQTKEAAYHFPLYLYLEDGTKVHNLNKEIVVAIENIVGETTPEEIIDYVYAVLHSPKYRKKYNEFLKIDFPRIPYPKNKNVFLDLVKFGKELRLLHLLESPNLEKVNITFPKLGSDKVEDIKYLNGKVIINEKQYFGNVPAPVWNFYIGGYQPAQKWLKERRGRILTNNEIEQYQKIIVALTETDRIMKEINKLDFE